MWDNIGQFKDAFEIVKNTDPLGIQYDYESIMHYPWSAFSVNGEYECTDQYWISIPRSITSQIWSIGYSILALFPKFYWRMHRDGRKKHTIFSMN